MIGLKLICLLGCFVGCLSQEFRLLDHGEVAANAGIVEVSNVDGEWGMICDDAFEQVDGDAICRFLGYPDAADIFIGAAGYDDSASIAAFGAYEGAILLDDMACSANASSLADCYSGEVPWGSHNCVNGEAVGVRCNLNIRLLDHDAVAERAGLVEVRNEDGWGMVCDDAFEQVDGDALCRLLGFASGAAQIYIGASGYEDSASIAAFGAYNGTILLDDMACAEDSASLADCYGGTVPWGSHNCVNGEAVAVRCNLNIRLIANDAPAVRAGIVEVRNEDGWGMICDDYFEDVDGDAVCRLLGFPSATGIYIGAGGYQDSDSIAAFGAYNGTILLDDMACNADSASLADCYGGTVPWGSHNCRNVEAVGVSCMCDMPCFAAHAGAHISNGEPAGGIMSLCDCQDLCQASDTCIGFDFNAESEPYGGSSCWLHSVAGDLVAPYMDVTHYANVC